MSRPLRILLKVLLTMLCALFAALAVTIGFVATTALLDRQVETDYFKRVAAEGK